MSSNPDEQKDLLLSHEYDGIREYDNPMPGWWKTIYWLTFYFSVAYMFHYQWSDNGDSVQEEYEAELSAAREAEAKQMMGNAVSEESLAEFMSNAGLMADAKKTFILRCSQCHGPAGEGLIGPNLTDNHWLHGDGSLMTIHRVIDEGVPAKGMPPWGRQLRPIELRKLSAFVGTMRNTHLKGPKGPEGTEYPAGGGKTAAAASAPATSSASPAASAPAASAPAAAAPAASVPAAPIPAASATAPTPP